MSGICNWLYNNVPTCCQSECCKEEVPIRHTTNTTKPIEVTLEEYPASPIPPNRTIQKERVLSDRPAAKNQNLSQTILVNMKAQVSMPLPSANVLVITPPLGPDQATTPTKNSDIESISASIQSSVQYVPSYTPQQAESRNKEPASPPQGRSPTSVDRRHHKFDSQEAITIRTALRQGPPLRDVFSEHPDGTRTVS